jgi:hypothetical protein
MTVVVMGMHRSGTSAVTRVVSLLGVRLCRPEDLVRGHDGNERGHWECGPLVAENERLLQSLASRWWCPPDSTAEVAAIADDPARLDVARAIFMDSHPTGPAVWKDPRTCLLLPFWRRALPRPPVVILVCRHPTEIAASMLARDRISPRFGLALWERYMTFGIESAQGLPIHVTNYADLIADPIRWCTRTVSFLRSHDVEARLPVDAAGIEGFVSRGLRHGMGSVTAPDSDLTPAHRELWEGLQDWARVSPEDAVPQLPELDPASRTLMNEVREAFQLRGVVPRPSGTTFVSTTGVKVLQHVPPAPTRRVPDVSVLFLPAGRTASLSEARLLRPRLPRDAEIITVAGQDDPAGGRPRESELEPDWFVVVRRNREMSLAERLNTAAEVARGQLLVILAGPKVTLLPGWLPPLRAALDQPDCAVACPALYPSDGQEPAFGLALSSLLLTAEWITDSPADQAPFPVPSATIAAMVTARTAFNAVGGFDEGLAGAGGEDVEYCLRLWRTGWRCLAVPRSRVQMQFETIPADDVDVTVNALRLGIVHLDGRRLTEQLEQLAPGESFAEALSRVNAGDAGRRRRMVDALAWYDTSELPRSLGVELVPSPGDERFPRPEITL